MDDGQLFYNIANRSGETIDWLEENGMDLVYVGNEQKAHANGFPTYHAYADQSNKLGYYQALLKQFENAGGKIYYQTPAVELKSDGNKITGVVAKSSDTTYEISCDAAVLATGGFGANADVIEKEVGFPLVTFTTGTQTGDGATMSQAIGAGKGKTIQQYHGVTSYSGIEPGSGKDEIAKAIYLATSIWVNQRGSRFAPEDLNYDTALSSNAAATQGEYYFSIMSDDMVKKVEQGGSKELNVETAVGYQPSLPLFSVNEPWTEFKSALEDGVKNGTVFKGDTVEDLAKAMGVDANALKKTISAYNADCANESDAVYGKDSKYMLSLGDGPYYAVKARPVSLGGIVNEQCYLLLATTKHIDLKQYSNIHVGYSMQFERFHHLDGYARQAEYAASKAKGKEANFQNLIDSYLRSQLEEQLPLDTLIDLKIQKLISYDHKYETKYYETLCMYVNSQYSKQKTAEGLYIHLNTVKYRLQQIEKLFDIDFEKDEKLIRLAMLVHHV